MGSRRVGSVGARTVSPYSSLSKRRTVAVVSLGREGARVGAAVVHEVEEEVGWKGGGAQRGLGERGRRGKGRIVSEDELERRSRSVMESRNPRDWECSTSTRRREVEGEDAHWIVERLAQYCSGQPTKWREALALVSSTRARGQRLPTVAYNTLMYALARSGQLKHVEETVEQMRRGGIRRSEKTYAILIHAYGKRGFAVSALEVFEEMVSEGLEPTEVCYVCVLEACRQRGWHRAGRDIYEGLKARGHRPTPNIFAALFGVMKEGKRPNESRRLLAEMKEMCVPLTARSAGVLVTTFADAGMRAEVQSLLTWVMEAENVFRLDAVVCVCLLKGARSLGEERLRATLAWIRQVPVTWDARLYRTAIFSHGLLGEVEAATELIGDFQARFGPTRGGSESTRRILLGSLRGNREGLEKVFSVGDMEAGEEDSLSPSPADMAGYNVMLDTLWDEGSRYAAVRLIGRALRDDGIYKNTIVERDGELNLNLLGLSAGASGALVIHAMQNLSSRRNEEGLSLSPSTSSSSSQCDSFPEELSIVVGWGRKAPFLLREQYAAVQALLLSSGSPFSRCKENPGVFLANGSEVKSWLKRDEAELWGVEWLLR